MIRPQPAVFEVAIKVRGKEVILRRDQAVDSVGRPAESELDTFRAIVADARRWITANRKR